MGFGLQQGLYDAPQYAVNGGSPAGGYNPAAAPNPYGTPMASAQPAFGGAQPGVGSQGDGPFGGFLSGVGRQLGLGGPRQISGVDNPQISRDDYYLGGSQGAANQALGQSYAQQQQFLGRGGPQLGPLDLSTYNQAVGQFGAQRQNEAAYLSQLQNAAAGRGPSVAQAQYLQAADDATRRAAGTAFAARGGMGLLGARQAAEQQFAGTQQAAAQSGIQRTQEMLGAQQQLGGFLGQQAQMEQARAQAGLAGSGLGLQYGQAQAGLDLANRGQNDAAYGNEAQRYLQMLQGNQQGLMGYNAQGSQNYLGAAGLNAQIAQTNLQQQNQADQRRANLLKSVAGGVGKVALGAFGL